MYAASVISTEHVERAERSRDALQRRDRRAQVRKQPFEQQTLPGEGALLRGQCLVLERLEVGRDIAFGVLERLPPAVVGGNALDVRVCDLDVEAVNAVVFDFEACDAGALA